MPFGEVLLWISSKLGQFSLAVTLCLILTLFARKVFRKVVTAQTIRLLWLILVLRCLIPWSFPLAYSSANIINPITQPSKQSTEILSSTSSTSLGITTRQIQVNPNVIRSTKTQNTPSSIWLQRDIVYMMLGAVWGLGAIIFIGLILVHNCRISLALTRDSVPVSPWLQELFQECRRDLKLRVWPVLIVSSHIGSPCLKGALRPYILMPVKLAESGDRELCRHVLLHELIHLKQGDIWLSWLWSLAWAIHWFNPLMWWAGRCMNLDRETACDERVLRVLGAGQQQSYGRSLLGLLNRIQAPARCAGLAGVIEQKSHLNRRLIMIQNHHLPRKHKLAASIGLTALVTFFSLTSFAAPANQDKLSSEKAEMMGRVEDFFNHNYRDITARKSLEWGDVAVDKDGNRTIRYKFEAQIWEKKWTIQNDIFTFDKDGDYVKVESAPGYPKDKIPFVADTTTKEGMIALVELFFTRNFRDITTRKIIEWGEPQTDKEGNRSIRHKYYAQIWGKEWIINNQIFTFDPQGEYLHYQHVEGSPQKNVSPPTTVATSDAVTAITINTPKETVGGFTAAAARGDVNLAMRYMFPGGVDYQDTYDILTATDSSSSKYQFRKLLESVDPEIPLQITSEKTEKDICQITWLMTFKQSFNFGEQSFEKGSTCELDATLKHTPDGWLIDNI